MKKELYKKIANALAARENCIDHGNHKWLAIWEKRLEKYGRQLPSGSGIDRGTRIDIEKSSRNRIVLKSSFHCMDKFGYYTHWIDFRVVVTGSLLHGFDLNIRGPFGKEQTLKDYLYDVFNFALDEEV